METSAAKKRLSSRVLVAAGLTGCLALTVISGTSSAKPGGKSDKVAIKAPSSLKGPSEPGTAVALPFKVKGDATGSRSLWVFYSYNHPCKSTAKAENASSTSTLSANGQFPASVKGKFSKQALASVTEQSGTVDLCAYLAKGTGRNIKATTAHASKAVAVTS